MSCLRCGDAACMFAGAEQLALLDFFDWTAWIAATRAGLRLLRFRLRLPLQDWLTFALLGCARFRRVLCERLACGDDFVVQRVGLGLGDLHLKPLVDDVLGPAIPIAAEFDRAGKFSFGDQAAEVGRMETNTSRVEIVSRQHLDGHTRASRFA